MAFSIIVKENNKDIFNLLRNRLSLSFPDAYIINNGTENFKEDIEMSEFTTSICDNRNNKLLPGEIPLFSINNNGTYYIDCSELVNQINKNLGESSEPKSCFKSKDKMHLLISYAYIEEREAAIIETFSYLKDISDFPIRIDLMSGIRMSSSIKTGLDNGSLTSLLKDANNPKFNPNRILEYLNPELSGFLTPGRPDNSDDVFEFGIKTCIKLINHLRTLVYSNSIDSSALVVIEGFRTSEIKSIMKQFDTIHFLLPSRMCDESIGMNKLINEFNLLLSKNQQLLIHYTDKKYKDSQNETIKI